MQPDHQNAPSPNVIDQMSQLWSRLQTRQRMVIAILLLGVLIGIGVMTTNGGGERQAVLFSGLAANDAGEVVQRLQADKVPYHVEAGGSVISVPESRVHELRLLLAADGLPRGGSIGFEIFDKSTFGTSNFVEQLNYRRALEGELARTIGSLAAIDTARVHISMGERSLYRKEDQPPTASVMLNLRSSESLTKSQARGIVRLVASSVPGLTVGRVTIVDQNGTLLAGNEDEETSGEHRNELEKLLANRIETMVERVVGTNQAEVTVTAELDTQQVERTEELYEQSPENYALRSEAKTLEGEAGAIDASGVSGTRGNLPGAPAPSSGAVEGGLKRVSETKNYEVNRIVHRTVGPKTRVRRLHVAVLVDGVPDKDGKIVPRGKEELTRIESIAREAAGFDEERGDRIQVHSVPFAKPEPIVASEIALSPMEEFKQKIPWWAMPASIAGGVLLALVVLWLMVRRRSHPDAELVQQYPIKVRQLEANVAGLDGSAPQLHQASVRDRALAAARSDAEQAARVISSWLAEQQAPTGSRS